MPNNAPITKKNAVAGYGAKIFECTPTLKARFIFIFLFLFLFMKNKIKIEKKLLKKL